MDKNINNLEKKIDYNFSDKELLLLALTHSSYINECKKDKNSCNERLEFLGDAVLEMTCSEYLFSEYPDKDEGELTKLRASIVSEMPLAEVASQINLGEYLYLGHGEDETGGRTRYSVTSDAVEALIGAIYLDGGLGAAEKFVKKYILNDIYNKKLFYDSKTVLQEIIQKKYREGPVYKLVKEEGPDHKKNYGVNAVVKEKVLGYGEGKTKKAAEQMAAFNAIKSIGKATER